VIGNDYSQLPDNAKKCHRRWRMHRYTQTRIDTIEIFFVDHRDGVPL
jgi:hypothetical protein